MMSTTSRLTATGTTPQRRLPPRRPRMQRSSRSSTRRTLTSLPVKACGWCLGSSGSWGAARTRAASATARLPPTPSAAGTPWVGRLVGRRGVTAAPTALRARRGSRGSFRRTGSGRWPSQRSRGSTHGTGRIASRCRRLMVSRGGRCLSGLRFGNGSSGSVGTSRKPRDHRVRFRSKPIHDTMVSGDVLRERVLSAARSHPAAAAGISLLWGGTLRGGRNKLELADRRRAERLGHLRANL